MSNLTNVETTSFKFKAHCIFGIQMVGSVSFYYHYYYFGFILVRSVELSKCILYFLLTSNNYVLLSVSIQ